MFSKFIQKKISCEGTRLNHKYQLHVYKENKGTEKEFRQSILELVASSEPC